MIEMTEKKILDGYNATFKTSGEFLLFLNEREGKTIRKKLPAKEVRFFSLSNTIKKNGGTLSAISPVALSDTVKNTDIVARIGKGDFAPIGESAWISMKGRAEIYGRGVRLLKSDLQSTILNKRFADLGKREVQVVTVEGKIRAIMSDEYAVIPASDFFTQVLEHIKEKYSEYKMVLSYVDHNVSRLKITFPKIADSLNGAYNLPHKYTPGLIIETSDTGFCANRICGFWESGGGISFITEGNKIELIHIGEATIERVLDQLPNIFVKYQNVVKKFASLMLQEIEFPLHTLKRACKELKLPKKATKAILEQFNLCYTGQPFTAYDIVREILAAPSLVDLETAQQIMLEERVEKAINLNFQKLQEDE